MPVDWAEPGWKRETFPGPYLQPDRSMDCGFYAAAYIARCLGHPEVSAEQVKAWRAETCRHEDGYAANALGAEARTFWDEPRQPGESMGEALARGKFWLGPAAGEWVRTWLSDGWIGHAEVRRTADFGHAVVLLDADDDEVLLMDPLSGHVTEPWAWFLGSGPGTPGAHYIAGWYQKAAVPVATSGNRSGMPSGTVIADSKGMPADVR